MPIAHRYGLVGAVEQALFVSDPSVDRATLVTSKGKRAENTCEWIKENGKFQGWLHGDTTLLWIHGGPGKGKTMLSIFLTEELEKIASKEKNTELLFYFCVNGNEKQNNAVVILKSLVHQIITKRPEKTKHILSHFDTPEKARSTSASAEALWIVFKKLLDQHDLGKIYCVLDGLDECDENTTRLVADKFVDLCLPHGQVSDDCRFRMMIVSRDISELGSAVQIELDSENKEDTSSDLQRFVSFRVEELSRLPGFSKIRTFIQNTLLKRAEGTFLWVGFAMIELKRKQTCTEVVQALKSRKVLPKGLSSMYGRMLLQIASSQRNISTHILLWVTMAVRNLTLSELADALGIQTTDILSAEEVVRDHIILCGPILKISGLRVGLVHQSARDYLLREDSEPDPVLKEFRIRPEEADLTISLDCINCIERSSLRSRPKNLDYSDRQSDLETKTWEKELDRLCRQNSSLFSYAMFNWPQHASRVGTAKGEASDFSYSFFLEHSILREKWWKLCGENPIGVTRLQGHCNHEYTPPRLHMACILGISSWLRVILDEKTQRSSSFGPSNHGDQNGIKPLHYAVAAGHEIVVKLLLDRGADVEAESRGKRALHEAIKSPHTNIVKLLLEHGADANSKISCAVSAPYTSVCDQEEASTQMLLDYWADANARDESGATALHYVIKYGYREKAQLLLRYGADINMRNQVGETPLHYAAYRWQGAIRGLLRCSGANVFARDKINRRVLQKAAHYSREDLPRNLRLRNASKEERKGIIRMLPGSGADINARDKDQKTVFHVATKSVQEPFSSFMGYQRRFDSLHSTEDRAFARLRFLDPGVKKIIEEPVQLLLDGGANAEAKDFSGRTYSDYIEEFLVKTGLHEGFITFSDSESVFEEEDFQERQEDYKRGTAESTLRPRDDVEAGTRGRQKTRR